MEEIVASHPSVAECAVFGVHCDLKGQKPLGLIVLKTEKTAEDGFITNEIIQEVRKEIGAVASFKDVLVVKRLPKTRSGKILRKLLRNIADEYQYNTPSTIDDVSIIEEIQSIYKTHRIGIHK
jgi:propionyl-CoA synthetase